MMKQKDDAVKLARATRDAALEIGFFEYARRTETQV